MNTAINKLCGDIPTELTYTPVPFIAFWGLNPSNQIHTFIWNHFTVNRLPNRMPLYFKLLDQNHVFASPKTKKSSYDWHIPKGILKTNWLSKHLFEIPSVAVLFFDLEWDDANWNEKQRLCVSKFEHLKKLLHGRNTLLAIVLIQRNEPFPGDDLQMTERAASLCTACDLSPKSLFTLPINDPQHVMVDYILRVENIFYEMAKAYYTQESRLIRAHKDQLNKTTHGLLFVRHQFKLAFFSELKQETANALKHYKQAYANLMEVRATVTNLLEVKTIAGFINYKICKLSFQMNDPLDAISQFRKHIDIFRGKTEPTELAFEHASWISKQYLHFGDLFEEAISNGLVASALQNPGYYYYEAALFAQKQRDFCLVISISIPDTVGDNLQSDWQDLEFFGQRHWRPGCQSLEPLDTEKETEGIKYLQRMENKVNHSVLVINLLSKAVAQFKKNKCHRMKWYMMVLIGKEYYRTRDYINALTFFNQVLPYYRSEKWKSIVTSIISDAIYCAYFSGSLGDFVKLGIEYINDKKEEEKENFQSCLEDVIHHKIPKLLNTSHKKSNSLQENWLKSYEMNENINLIVNMENISSFIEVKVKFLSPHFFSNEKVKFQVSLLSNFPRSLEFQKLNVIFTNSHYNQYCKLMAEKESKKLILPSRQVQTYSFEFFSLSADSGMKITVLGVSLSLGNSAQQITLNWSFESDVRINSPWVYLPTRNDILGKPLEQILSTNIIRRKANIDINCYHEEPALLHELYLINLVIYNNEEHPIDNVTVTPKLKYNNLDLGDTDVKNVSEVIFDGIVVADTDFLQVADSIAANDSVKKLFLVKTLNLGFYNLSFTVNYELIDTRSDINSQDGTKNSYICTKTEDIEFECIVPFEFSFPIYSLRLNPLKHIRIQEPFVLQSLVKNLSPFKLSIDLSLEFSENFDLLMIDDSNTKIRNFILDKNERSEENFKMCCILKNTTPTPFGSMILQWKRSSNLFSKQVASSTKVVLPDLNVESSLLYIETELPAFGTTRKPLLLVYVIYNRSQENLPLELSMGNSENFMYAGNKQIKLDIPIYEHRKQHYILYPLVCGSVALPKLRIVCFPDEKNSIPMNELLDEILPSYIQIMPQEKGMNELNNIKETNSNIESLNIKIGSKC